MDRADESLVKRARHVAGRAYRKLSGEGTVKPSKKSNRPLVGMWRPDLFPGTLSKTLALMAPSQGIDLVYFNNRDVDMEKGLVHGRRLKPKTALWERVTTRIPDIVDVSSYCWKDDEVRAYLEERCWCTDLKRNKIPKYRLQKLLAKEDDLKRYAIPSVRFPKGAGTLEKNSDSLVAFVKAQGDAVVKPIYSSRGRGVHRVSLDPASGLYSVSCGTEARELDEEGLRSYAAEHFFSGKAHMAQKYVSSRTLAGDPFDCRVHVEKNGVGKWKPASMLVRIGLGQSIMSNINQGGGMAELEPFLKANRPDNWEEIIERLKELADTVPYWYEQQRGVELCTLGIDTGITPEGDLHIFEINSLPFVDFNAAQVAALRICYFRWAAKKHLGF